MKKETFKQMLFSAALLTSVFEVQAQDNPITFTRDMTFRETMVGRIVCVLPKSAISIMTESMIYGWTASVNRIVGKPVLCLPKDWEKGRSRPTLNL